MTSNANNTKHGKTYVVEHLDPELEAWQILEYRTIALECAASNNASFILSGVPPQLLASLSSDLAALATSTPIESSPTITDKSRICLLDPQAASDLSPSDAAEFDVFLFGGILGDDPPRDRTAELRAKGFAGRRLGAEQMTTDTAARVTRMVVQDGVALSQIPFVDRPDIEVARGETVSMPFKYVRRHQDGGDGDGKGGPVMPEGMLELLARDADKGILDLL